MPALPTVILGSRSPRRQEILAHLVPSDRIIIQPPLNAEELEFEGLKTQAEIEARIKTIVMHKLEDVRNQRDTPQEECILVADTIVIVNDEHGAKKVLGKPPRENWQQTVRSWFNDYYFKRPHQVATCIMLSADKSRILEQIVITEVTLQTQMDHLEWYLSTAESIGKAGGYGLQGAGSLFVDKITGSPSNVIGLPLRETRELLAQAGALG